MIIVDVRIPALEKVYNLLLDEKASVGELIEEITELVLQKEGVLFSGDLQEAVLGCVERGLHCSREACLSDYGIRDGETLILV